MVFYWSILFTVLSVLIAVLGAILGWGVFPMVVEDQITEGVILVENTEQYDRWEKIPFPLDFKVYLFNIENAENVTKGDKPILKQMGPYIYDQYRHKYNITRNGDTLSYYQKQVYEFNAEKSFPFTQDDPVNVLHVPLNSVIHLVEMDSPFLLWIVNQYLKDIFDGAESLILTTSVRKILFDGVPLCNNGVEMICDIIKSKNSTNMREEKNGTLYFSLFNHKNNSDDGHFTVKTGENDPKEIGKIIRWKDDTEIHAWPKVNNETNMCNMINGTDASIFSPFQSKHDTNQIFNTDICRSVTTYFSEITEYKGISAYKYVARDDILPSPSENSSTICFCPNVTKGITQENGCLKKGVMELFPCMEAHMVLSLPHFLWADEEYQNGVIGLSPNEKEHQITLELEPNTGTPLRGGKRIQFNMFLRPVSSIKMTKKLNTTLVPIMWLDEGTELPDDLVAMLNADLFDVLEILEAVKWTLIAVGAAGAIASLTVFLCKRKKHTTV